MNEPRTIPLRPRDRLFAAVTLVLAALLLPVAFVRDQRRARELACRWALGMRFPAEDLTGLTEDAAAAFTAARTDALWHHRQLIGLTSGYRDPLVQQRLFDEEVRPREGARWLEEHGARHDLNRTHAIEWWHFEYRPDKGGTPRTTSEIHSGLRAR